MNKKSQTGEDVIFMAIILLVLAIGGVIIAYVYDQFYTTVQTTSGFNDSEAAMAVYEKGDALTSKLDYVIFVVLMGFMISVIILGYFVDAHPIFMVLFLIFLVIAIILSIPIKHVWVEFYNADALNSIASSKFPLTNFILSNLTIFTTVIGGMALFATYAKTKRAERMF